jgi:chromosomal replication initiation ATPase DnaA
MLECTRAQRCHVWGGKKWPRNRWRLKRLQRDAKAHALIKCISSVRGIPLYDLLDDQRGLAAVCETRQLAMYLVHVVLGRPQDEVGRLFGRQRSTVAHACHITEDRREAPEIEEQIARIEARYAQVSAEQDWPNQNAT